MNKSLRRSRRGGGGCCCCAGGATAVETGGRYHMVVADDAPQDWIASLLTDGRTIHPIQQQQQTDGGAGRP